MVGNMNENICLLVWLALEIVLDIENVDCDNTLYSNKNVIQNTIYFCFNRFILHCMVVLLYVYIYQSGTLVYTQSKGSQDATTRQP